MNIWVLMDECTRQCCPLLFVSKPSKSSNLQIFFWQVFFISFWCYIKWSQIFMDFVTGLPILERNTVVMWSWCHLILLPRLYSAKETANLMDTERMNQELEKSLHCLSSQNPLSCSPNLEWIEYTHNTVVCTSIGCFPVPPWPFSLPLSG